MRDGRQSLYYIPIAGKATFCENDAGGHAVDPHPFPHPLQRHALGQVLHARPGGAAEGRREEREGGREGDVNVFAYENLVGLHPLMSEAGKEGGRKGRKEGGKERGLTCVPSWGSRSCWRG